MKPMLAATAKLQDLANLHYPVYASAKLDGIRCLVDPVLGPVSRTLKPIPNEFVRNSLMASFTKHYVSHVDGELIVGPSTAKDVFQRTTSGVMTREGEPDFTYWIFDSFKYPDRPWSQRRASLFNIGRIRVLDQQVCTSVDDVLELEDCYLRAGYEGIMLRSPKGLYKFNRSTLKEQYLIKFKRFADSEAQVVGYEERMTNTNEQTRDERGYAKRSSHKDGKVPTGTLGALVCMSDEFCQRFNVGTGFDDEQRAKLWKQRDRLIGRVVKFKHQSVGAKDLPRFPVFLGFRKD